MAKKYCSVLELQKKSLEEVFRYVEVGVIHLKSGRQENPVEI